MSLVTTLAHVLPHRLLSSLARRLAYSDNARLKQWLIDTVTAKFGVVLSEAANPDATAYPTFNAFFTRALKSGVRVADPRSEEHTSELQSLMRISYAVFCLKKKRNHNTTQSIN